MVCLKGHLISLSRRNNIGSSSCFFVVLITVVSVIFNCLLTTLAAPLNGENTTIAHLLHHLHHHHRVTSETVKKDPFVQSTQGGNENEMTEFTEQGPTILDGTTDEIIVYEVGRILPCAAFGKTKPKVTWEYYGKSLPDNLIITENPSTNNNHSQTIAALLSASANVDNSVEENTDFRNNNIRQSKDSIFTRRIINFSKNDDLKKVADKINKTSWVGFKLPKLNMAFYGKFICKAENEDGVSTKAYYLIHNANSSVLMKFLRTSVAIILLLSTVACYRFCRWYGIRKKIKRYEKLPTEELEIVRRFQRGIKAPSKSPIIPTLSNCKSYISTTTAETIDLCSNFNSSVAINSWAKFVSYDDRKDVYRNSFKIDFDNTLQSSDYGLLLAGKIRSPKTMKWQRVAVKTRKVEDENNIYIFENLLTELKLLASLPEENYCIVNLQAAFTRKLYKREIYLFVDNCENGSLDRFINLNRHKFRDLFTIKSQSQEVEEITPPPRKKRMLCSDENQNSSPPKSDLEREWSFSTEDLLVWSGEIADGMRFLHKHKVMHGNLCPANVFLSDELVAKIGNIGHSPKQLYFQNERRLEVQLYEEYSSMSDVWSFGNTLWEIFALNLQPSPTTQDIINFFTLGKPLGSPKYSNIAVQMIIQQCWNVEENLQPDFVYLSDNFRRILKDY